jgi:hypothetical protein
VPSGCGVAPARLSKGHHGDGERAGCGVAGASVAEQLTVVIPFGKYDPEAGLQLGVTEPSTRSVAVAV